VEAECRNQVRDPSAPGCWVMLISNRKILIQHFIHCVCLCCTE
jgi:hypothetical protein